MIGLLGCDKRLEVIYDKLKCFYEVIISDDLKKLQECDILVLPPAGVIDLDLNLNLKAKKIITGRIVDELEEYAKKNDIILTSYFDDEDYVIENAYLTVQVLLEIILKNVCAALSEYNILILGYGYCGCLCALNLKEHNLNLDIFTIDKLESKYAKMYGFNHINNLDGINKYNLIINTIPHNIIASEKINLDALVFDIASYPYLLKDEKQSFTYLRLPKLPEKKLIESSTILYQALCKKLG